LIELKSLTINIVTDLSSFIYHSLTKLQRFCMVLYKFF